MKTDMLAECNNLKVPFQDFAEAFCSRCLQKDCTRSQAGKSRFEARISTWEDRLFNNVAKMDPSDERYKEISAQSFVSISANPRGATASWVDPRDIETTKVISIPAPQPTVVPVPVFVPPEPPKPIVLPMASVGRLVNTPTKSGQIIGEGPQKASSPVSDPWRTAPPLKPGDVVVKPGAKIKLGV